MCQFDYTKSYKKVSNGDRIAIKASREGKNPANCSLVENGSKSLIIVAPWKMSIREVIKRSKRHARSYSGYTIIPVSLPMGAS